MQYNKLIRDNIPDIIHGKGQKSVTHIADHVEYRQKLIEKLHEEAGEYVQSGELEELVDVMEVVYALAALENVSREQLEVQRKAKQTERGGFSKKIILDEVI